MAKILVMLITGKENINTEMVAFSFAFNAVKNASERFPSHCGKYKFAVII